MDDAMDGSAVKRRNVKELTKQGGKRSGTTKRAKKSMVAPTSPKKTHSRGDKKQKKIEKQTKKDLKKITKGFGNLKANDGKVKPSKEPDSLEVDKPDANEKLKQESWAKTMKDLALLPTTSPLHKEILDKCEGHIVPRHPKSVFISWIEEHLHYSRATHYSQLKTLYKKVNRLHRTVKPWTKTEKRRQEKKRSKIRKQILAQATKANEPVDEKKLLKMRAKNMKKKEKQKKKKLENLMRKKSGLKIKDATPLSEEQKDVAMKELKKAKKAKKKGKTLGL